MGESFFNPQRTKREICPILHKIEIRHFIKFFFPISPLQFFTLHVNDDMSSCQAAVVKLSKCHVSKVSLPYIVFNISKNKETRLLLPNIYSLQ